MTDRIFSQFDPVGFAGPQSRDGLAYRYYDKDRVVMGKTMAEHLRLAVCYWHSFAWAGSDVFGAPVFQRPWEPASPVTDASARIKLDNAFDFFRVLGLPFFAFHDADAMAAAETPSEHRRSLAAIVEPMAERMASTGVKLLWGTANLFSHQPRS